MVANNTGDRNDRPAPRRRSALTSLLLMALATVAMLAACYRGPRLSETAPETVVKVDNQGFDDMNIYVLPPASNRIRLGFVSGKSTATLTIPARLVPSVRSLRFVATPIATQRGPVSEEITVVPGDTVVLRIPPL